MTPEEIRSIGKDGPQFERMSEKAFADYRPLTDVEHNILTIEAVAQLAELNRNLSRIIKL